jgi:hypothetical protein
LRNADPMVRYIGLFKPEITGFFGNVTAATQAADTQSPNATGQALHYIRASQTLTPSELAFYPRPLGIERDNAYRAPGAYKRLANALTVMNASGCLNGNPALPSSASPADLVALIQQNVFRTTGRNVAAPSCLAQGPIPGFSGLFPQLRVDPPPTVPGG